jgi:hypothetical protein
VLAVISTGARAKRSAAEVAALVGD